MNVDAFKSFTYNHKALLDGLADKKIFFITSLTAGALLQDELAVEENASFFQPADLEVLEQILSAPILQVASMPVIYVAPKAVGLFAACEGTAAEKADQALSLCRFSFMGTDGMRGKIAADGGKNCLALYSNENQLSPQLISLSAKAFSRMVIDAGKAASGQCAVVGNDGRDRAVDGLLGRAMNQGFADAGLDVLDLGIVPTPFVPYQMLKRNHPCGAALTASHNPANQNGIKFFLNGKKLVPEGVLGDFTLSAYMFAEFLNDESSDRKGQVYVLNSAFEEHLQLLRQVVPSGFGDSMKECYLVVDNANGAFADLTDAYLKELDIPFRCVNSVPDGSNINQGCGVAEVEGQEEFSPEDYDSCLPVVRAVFDEGRSRTEPVFGLVLDGDGDRGFILSYQKDNDHVYVLDGDKSGYLLAEYMLKDFTGTKSSMNFVLTVESDLMTAYHAANTLGLKVHIVSVGDKWICNFSEGPLLLGLEASGHLIFPIPFSDNKDEEKILLAGNGLLTALMTLASVRFLELTGDRIREPFEAGFAKTFYTYFVDKSLFYRGSAVWNADKELIRQGIEDLRREGVFPTTAELVFEDKEDSDMLYGAVREGDSFLAAVFCRNSGTEDKTAVYVQGSKQLSQKLTDLGQRIAANHLAVMKNRDRIEFQVEKAVITRLESTSPAELSGTVADAIASAAPEMKEQDVLGVIYGLKKEGRVSVVDGTIALIK